jgi:hypothetical protein
MTRERHMHGNGGVNDYMTYFFAMQALLFPSSPASSQDPAVPQITTRPEAVTHGIAIMTLVWFGSRFTCGADKLSCRICRDHTTGGSGRTCARWYGFISHRLALQNVIVPPITQMEGRGQLVVCKSRAAFRRISIPCLAAFSSQLHGTQRKQTDLIDRD